MSGASGLPIALVSTPRIARKAVAQPTAGLPSRQNSSQQCLGQPTGPISAPQAGSATNSWASTPIRNSLDQVPIPVSSSMSETGSIYAIKASPGLTSDLAQRPPANIFQAPSSIASVSSDRTSISGPTLVSPGTNATSLSSPSSPPILTHRYSVDSATKEEPAPSYLALCGNCEEGELALLHHSITKRKDLEGKIYYENTLAGQSSCTVPKGLPPGWREAKDPDGKLFFVHDELQLASWYRPGEQPPGRRPDSVGTATTSNSAGNTSNVVVKYSKPDAVTKPAQAVAKPNPVAIKPNRTSPTVTVKLPNSQQVNLQTATEAAINLIGPAEGGIVRSTKIAAHIAGQGAKSTVKAIKSNQRLQGFARGTGIATANRQVKKAWRKAAREVNARNGQEVTIRQSGSQGQDITLEEVDDGYNSEYVVEYDDGMVEYYSADGQLQPTVELQDISGARLSQPVSSGQRITGQQQYQNRQQRYQNTQRQAYLPPSTDSTWGTGPEESVFVNCVESQILYAGQEQNTYIDQNQDVFVLPSQDMSVEQSPTVYQGAEEFEIEQKLQAEYDQSMTQEIEVEGEGVDVVGDFDAGGNLDAYFNN
ncbi:MAG: hypothetical protein M1813_003690 [Trichoglossum hirsutum]|nr:MAG: hypothetical protein M1813_003690 [Trichoglossum hirsutum]